MKKEKTESKPKRKRIIIQRRESAQQIETNTSIENGVGKTGYGLQKIMSNHECIVCGEPYRDCTCIE